MSSAPFVPPLKCQGIKTKIVHEIARLAGDLPEGRWIEPFCGSCVVALNIRPGRALLCDSNIHIIRFYKDIQSKLLTPQSAREYLTEQGAKLKALGEAYYYEVRERFNENPGSLDFLFLNRSCFNGVMRFNRSGKFNVPFCQKVERFSPAYITKIVNQLNNIALLIWASDWEFRVSGFMDTLAEASAYDFVYADPPYAGRHTDYFNSWSKQDEENLAAALAQLPCKFILSTWHSNEFRTNEQVEEKWASNGFHIFTREHYYHVGATEELRHPMIEALIANYAITPGSEKPRARQLAFIEEPRSTYQIKKTP